MLGMALEVGSQVLVGRGGHSDDAAKPRCLLIEDEGLPGRVADGAATFCNEQDSGRCRERHLSASSVRRHGR